MIRDYTQKSSFFWRTELSDERIEEIAKWVNSLTDEEYKMLSDILYDHRKEVQWDSIEYEE